MLLESCAPEWTLAATGALGDKDYGKEPLGALTQHEVFKAYFFLDKCGGDKDLCDKVKEYRDQGLVQGHEYYLSTTRAPRFAWSTTSPRLALATTHGPA